MKRFNINEVIWFGILVSFAYYIYNLFYTEKINIYMHPRMFKYVLFSFIVFTVLSIFQIRRIFIPGKIKRIKLGYIIFIIPLFLVFTINPDGLSPQVASNKGVNIVNNKLGDTEKADINNEEAVINDEEEAIIDNNEHSPEIDMNIDSEEDYYNADAVRFMDTLIDSYENLDIMLGKEVELSGFVYRGADFSNNRFVLSRLLMTCCAADTQIAGILCEWSEESNVKDNVWIKVTGTIDKTTHNDQYANREAIVPIIKITKVEDIEPPKNQYVYP